MATAVVWILDKVKRSVLSSAVLYQTFFSIRNKILLAKVMIPRCREAKIFRSLRTWLGLDFVVAPEKYSWYKKQRYTGMQETRGCAVSFIPTPEPTLSG